MPATSDPIPWLTEAWHELGTTEHRGSADNPTIVGYSKDIGHTEVTDDEVPWCAIFVGACLERSRIASTRSMRARSYLNWGDEIDAARIGAIAVFSRGPNPALGHVGFVLADLGDTLVILGGNQSDAVTVQSFPRTRLLSMRWPSALTENQSTTERPIASQPTRRSELFDLCLDHVLAVEGGYGHDPYDPGGPTNLGITLATLARHRGIRLTNANHKSLLAELKDLTPATAAPIYRKLYWTPCHAAELPAPIALMHFDAAVNHGVAGAARLLQKALAVDIDGEIGPITLSVAHSGSPLAHVARYAKVRRDRYRSLHHFWRFGKGWLNRLSATLKAARAIPPDAYLSATPSPRTTKEIDMTSSTATTPPPTNSVPDQPIPYDTPIRQPKWWGYSLTIWGTIITTLATVLPVVGPVFGFDITADMVRQLGSATTHAIEAIGGVLGIVLTILGRIRAVQPLTRRPFQVLL